MGDGVVYPLREDSSPETLDLLNERAKWVEDGDSDGEEINTTATFTYLETINETDSEHSERAIVRTPDVVTFN